MEQFHFVQWLMQFPSLSVMVFLRRDIGYRILHPGILAAVTGALVTVTVLSAPDNPDARPMDLLVFALLFFVIGMYQRIKRWTDLKRGIIQHSHYIGSSPFDFRWLPRFCRINRRIPRFVDPIFCTVLGMVLFPVSRALSMWLVFSGLCLRSYEYQINRRQLNYDLDMMDSLVMSARQAHIMEQYDGTPNSQPQPAAGIPTGLADDIRDHIRNRKSSKT